MTLHDSHDSDDRASVNSLIPAGQGGRGVNVLEGWSARAERCATAVQRCSEWRAARKSQAGGGLPREALHSLSTG